MLLKIQGWFQFLSKGFLFGAQTTPTTKAKSNYRGYNQNPAIQKFYIHFFIDNFNAHISFYTLSCPDFNLGQLKVYKMKFTLELSMKKWI